jgi:hypothetical protein
MINMELKDRQGASDYPVMASIRQVHIRQGSLRAQAQQHRKRLNLQAKSIIRRHQQLMP